MTNNKLIEEIEKMSAIMSNASYADCAGSPLVPESQGICDKVDCHTCKQVRRLLNVGYHRQSEVAKEIFDEIERILLLNYCCCLPQGATEHYEYYEGNIAKDIAELKKKYTGEKEDDKRETD